MVELYYTQREITVDSYWEDHVMASHFYLIEVEDQPAGFFSIYKETLLTMFHLTENFAHLGQSVFEKVKKYEQVLCAYVPTGDEFLLCHCMDSFSKIEKQAYFARYKNEALAADKQRHLQFEKLTATDDLSILDTAGSFFEEENKERILNELAYFEVYVVKEDGKDIGFGVVEYGRVIRNMASIGMYVHEDKRQMGYAANILKSLQRMVESKGYSPRSGCWYYNHNSKKSMERAGAYAQSRLLKFYF